EPRRPGRGGRAAAGWWRPRRRRTGRVGGRWRGGRPGRRRFRPRGGRAGTVTVGIVAALVRDNRQWYDTGARTGRQEYAGERGDGQRGESDRGTPCQRHTVVPSSHPRSFPPAVGAPEPLCCVDHWSAPPGCVNFDRYAGDMGGYLGSYATLGLLLLVGTAVLSGAFGANRLLRPAHPAQPP